MDQQLPQISGQSAQMAPSSGGGLLDFITGPAEKLIASLGSDVSQAGSQVLKGITENPQDVSENAPELESAGNALGAIPELGTAVDAAEDVPKLAEGAGKDIEDLVSGGKAADKAMPAISTKTAAEIKAEKTAGTSMKVNAGAQETPIDPNLKFSNPGNNPTEPLGPTEQEPPNINNQSKPGPVKPPSEPTKPLPGGDPKDIPQKAVDKFKSMYPIATKTAVGRLQSENTARGMLAHLNSGMKFNTLEQAPKLIGGADGEVSKMVREVAGNIPGKVTAGDPAGAAKAILDAHKTYVNSDTASDILSDIRSAIPKSGDPLDMLGFARDLEGRAADIRQGSTYLTTRGDKEVMSHAFSNAADEVMEQLDKAAQGVPIESSKTPGRMKFLSSISPRLGQQVQNAGNLSELRSSMRDFTRFDKMAEQANAGKNSTFGQVATNLKQNSDRVADALTNPAKATKEGIYAGIKKAFSGFDKTPEDNLMSALKNKPSNGGAGKMLAGTGVAAGVGTAGYLAGQAGESKSNAEGYNQTNVPSQQHAQSVSQNSSNVNSSVSAGDLAQGKGVTLDSNGLVGNVPPPWQTLGSDGKSISVNGQAAKDQMQQLTTQYEAQLKAGDPNAKVTQGQIQNLQTSIQAGQKFEQGWQGNQEVDNLIKKAIPLISKSNLNALNMLSYGQIGAVGVNEAMNSNFGTLYGILQQIQKISPYAGNLLDSKNLVNGDTLQNALVGVNNTQWNQYRLSMQQFAGNTQGANGQVSANMIPATQQVPSGGNSPMPSIPANFKGFAGSVSQSGN